MAKIERAEDAIQKGQVTDHKEVKKLVATWNKK